MTDLRSLVTKKENANKLRIQAEEAEAKRVKAYKKKTKLALAKEVLDMLMAELNGNFGVTVHKITDPDVNQYFYTFANLSYQGRDSYLKPDAPIKTIIFATVGVCWTTETEKREDFPDHTFDVLKISLRRDGANIYESVIIQARTIETFRDCLADWVIKNKYFWENSK